MPQHEEHHYHATTKTVLLLCAAAVAILFLATRVFANDMHPVAYLPSIAQHCDPCTHSIPMPTLTPTAQSNEPPVP